MRLIRISSMAAKNIKKLIIDFLQENEAGIRIFYVNFGKIKGVVEIRNPLFLFISRKEIVVGRLGIEPRTY